jgi:hypothetical protein
LRRAGHTTHDTVNGYVLCERVPREFLARRTYCYCRHDPTLPLKWEGGGPDEWQKSDAARAESLDLYLNGHTRPGRYHRPGN